MQKQIIFVSVLSTFVALQAVLFNENMLLSELKGAHTGVSKLC